MKKRFWPFLAIFSVCYRTIKFSLNVLSFCIFWTVFIFMTLLVLQAVAKLTGGQGGRPPPPGRSFRSFWAPCHHIVNFIRWSLIDIAARQCVVLMTFGTLNYKNTLFLESTGKQANIFSIWNIATRHCWKILHKTSMSKCLNRGPSMHSWGPTHALKGPTTCCNFNRGALCMHSWGRHACNQGALRTHQRAPAVMLVNLFEDHYILTVGRC